MLRVTVELVPFGDESRKKVIGEMVIANDGLAQEPDVGNYDAVIEADTWSGQGRQYRRITDHPRESSVWYLILQLLNYGMGTKDKPQEKTGLHALLENRLKQD